MDHTQRPAASPAVGMSRAPVLTVLVLLPTAAVSVLGLVMPAVELALRRDRAAIDHGQVWRLATSLIVQDGGVAGTVFNLLGLAIVGVLAEQVLSRTRWVIGYLGGALAGGFAGWAGWQPTGAGNSVAVCGLAGVLAVALSRDHRQAAGPEMWKRAGAAAVVMWSALLAATGWTSSVPVIAGMVLVLSAGINLAVRLRASWLGLLAAPAVALAALVLLVDADIHGSALAAGLILGILEDLGPCSRPTRPTNQDAGNTVSEIGPERHRDRRACEFDCYNYRLAGCGQRALCELLTGTRRAAPKDGNGHVGRIPGRPAHGKGNARGVPYQDASDIESIPVAAGGQAHAARGRRDAQAVAQKGRGGADNAHGPVGSAAGSHGQGGLPGQVTAPV
jgi:membrane associated rhomboid family serine protease